MRKAEIRSSSPAARCHNSPWEHFKVSLGIYQPPSHQLLNSGQVTGSSKTLSPFLYRTPAFTLPQCRFHFSSLCWFQCARHGRNSPAKWHWWRRSSDVTKDQAGKDSLVCIRLLTGHAGCTLWCWILRIKVHGYRDLAVWIQIFGQIQLGLCVLYQIWAPLQVYSNKTDLILDALCTITPK